MRLSLVLGIIYFASEVLLSVTRRGRSDTGEKQDRSTLRVLWIVIMGSIAAGVFVSGRWKGATLPAGPDWAVAGVVVFALGLAFRWWAIVTLGRFFTST
jgi:protein-S-isoprenylcysteine O-methyltransferase Ste14